MIEVGQTYYYLGDGSFIVVVTSVDDKVTFEYLAPSILAGPKKHVWNGDNFEDTHKPITKLHKLLKGIE